MSLERSRYENLGLALLNLSAWIRAQPWLRAIYRCFPQTLRFRVSQMLTEKANKRVRFSRTPAWTRQLPAFVPPALHTSSPCGTGFGVNVFAYARGQFGLAEAARLYTRALLSEGCAVAVHDITLKLAHSMGDDSLDAHIGSDTRHPVNLIFVNPDYLDDAIASIGDDRLHGRRNIGCWFWELEKFPDEWLPALSRVDEILVSSAFVADIVRRVTDKPVLHVPLPVIGQPDSGLQRADFGIGEREFVFLCSFDFNSFIARKNPLAVIKAFRRAFADRHPDVRLLIKSCNGHRHPDQLRVLLNAAAADRRIRVRDEVIDRSHMQALQRCSDAYISLHRSEGFGLGLAECMRVGKPVIATAWSGNMDFMNEQNSCLVDYRLVPVGEGEYPHHAGQRWAEPDVECAALHMRQLVENRNFAARLGARAAQDVANQLAPSAIARCLIDCLKGMHRETGAAVAADRPQYPYS